MPTLKKDTNNDGEEESSNNIMTEYLKITKEYVEKYGENTVLLMQVGAFFEVYGMRDNAGNIVGSKIEEFSQICQLNISDKKIFYDNKPLVMAGFRDYTLEKYLQKITDAGYTAVVFVQEKDGKKMKRVFHGVFSAGTYLSYETESTQQMTNNIMCIWIDTFKPIDRRVAVVKTRDTIIYGVSVINTYTGKSSIFEYQTPFFMNPTTFDELERCISVFSPSELIFMSPFDEKINTQILQFIGTNCRTIHAVYTGSGCKDKITNCTKQVYINHILSQVLGDDVQNICKEFQANTMATQSFCYLLNFIQEHDKNLLNKISIPEFNNTSDRMILANHTLKQLNIIDDEGKRNGQLSSVLSFLNKCCTPMGRRKFQSQLLGPVTNIDWLNREYSMITTVLTNTKTDMVDIVRKELGKIIDIEKICRQIVIKKIYPSSLYKLFNSIKTIHDINVYLCKDDNICDYLCNNIDIKQMNSNGYIKDITTQIINFMNRYLVIENCKTANSVTNFDMNIIQCGIFESLDTVMDNYASKVKIFETVQKLLNSMLQSDNRGGDTEYIKIHETEKSGSSLYITKTRGELLKKSIQLRKKETYFFKGIVVNDGPITLSSASDESFTFKLSDITLSQATGANYEISMPQLTSICKSILYYKEKMNVIISQCYLTVIKEIEDKWFAELEQLAEYTASLDVLQSKAYVAKAYKYCSPKIVENVETPNKSYAKAIGLRHCLIEQLLQNELYEKNDVYIGDEIDGILLYGTNAVGKTSIIRALGISIVMAQAGMFVPCTEFIYRPYSSIYTRILGNDNIFKGLSTFAVEMSELRVILKMADEQSLILGDELCSGTETESALSIFVAGLTNLHAKKSSFVFATHFHEIVNYDEIKDMKRLSIKHMSVIYDKERDCLIYDRKLKDGPGTKTYGLEVCKSLYLPDDFMSQAYEIRNKYFPETRGELSQKTSVYNSKKVRGICEICKCEIAEETHHLLQQKEADMDGFIDNSIHKNHVANLLSVCEKCHHSLHEPTKNDGITAAAPKQRKKTTKGYVLL